MSIIIGLALLSVLFLLTYLSYKFSQSHVRYSLYSLLLMGLILRCFISAYPNLHKWDERFHALSAKNITKESVFPTLYKEHYVDYDTRNWMLEKQWVHKPPFLSYLIKGSLLVFGNTAFASRVPSIIASALTILFIFLIAMNLFGNRQIALVAAFLCAVNGLLLDFAGGVMPTDHFDTFLLFFFSVAMYFFTKDLNKERIWNVLLGIFFLFLAFQVKLFTALFAFYLVFFIQHIILQKNLWKTTRYLLTMSVVFVLLNGLAVWIIYQFAGKAFFVSMYELLEHISETYDQGGPWYFYINKIRENYGELIYAVLLFFIYLVYKKDQQRKLALLLGWMLIPIFILSFGKTKMPGYIIVTVPAIFIIYGVVINEIKEQTSWKFKNLLLFVLLLLIPLRYCIERVKPFINYVEMYQKHREYLSELQVLNSRSIVFEDPRSIETMFFSNATSYEIGVSSEKIDSLQKANYSIYHMSDNKLIPY